MNAEQLQQIMEGKGFIASLDQGKNTTPRALRLYGIHEDEYSSEEEMFSKMHRYRARIMQDHNFTNSNVIATIISEDTLNRKVEGEFTSDYLWNKKQIVPFIKITDGVEELANGVQLFKPVADLDGLIKTAKERNVFGTKAHSFIRTADEAAIDTVIDQQFEYAMKAFEADMVPIIEIEVRVGTPGKKNAEEYLAEELKSRLKKLPEEMKVIIMIGIPEEEDTYYMLTKNAHVLKVAAISGGQTRGIACYKLSRNKNVIAGFARCFLEGLNVHMDDLYFTTMLGDAIKSLVKASAN